jgi:hypothetical protein
MTSNWVSSRVRRDHVRGSGADARESRAARPDDTLATLGHRADEALATDGVARTRLGYEVLVKLKRDELREREDLPTDVREDGGEAEIGATSRAEGMGTTSVPIHRKTPLPRGRRRGGRQG